MLCMQQCCLSLPAPNYHIPPQLLIPVLPASQGQLGKATKAEIEAAIHFQSCMVLVHSHPAGAGSQGKAHVGAVTASAAPLPCETATQLCFVSYRLKMFNKSRARPEVGGQVSNLRRLSSQGCRPHVWGSNTAMQQAQPGTRRSALSAGCLLLLGLLAAPASLLLALAASRLRIVQQV